MREERGGESLLDFVVPSDALLDTLALQDVHDGGERLLVDDGGVVRQPRDDRRLHEVAFPLDHLPAELDLAAGLDGLVQGGLVEVDAGLAVQRAVEGAAVDRVAKLFQDRAVGLLQSLLWTISMLFRASLEIESSFPKKFMIMNY